MKKLFFAFSLGLLFLAACSTSKTETPPVYNDEPDVSDESEESDAPISTPNDDAVLEEPVDESFEKPEELQTYNAEFFSLQFPAEWILAGPGYFTSDNPNAQISFSHVSGDFEAPIYENIGVETYTSIQGITWTINYDKIREEFLGSFSPSARFVVIHTEDESFTGSTFLYSYDEELNPDAITQLKSILDSYRKNS